MSVETIKVPDIGGATDVDVIEVNVAVGDIVDAEQTLIVLETDKASMEIPSPQAGKVVSVLVSEGDKIAEGAAIVELEIAVNNDVKSDRADSVEVVTDAVQPTDGVQQEQLTEKEVMADDADKTLLSVTNIAVGDASDVDVTEVAVAAVSTASGSVHAGPAVRKIAREFGVELAKVRGSGPKGRVIKEDVQKYVKAALDNPATSGGSAIPLVPVVDFAKFGPIREEPMSKIAKITAANMQRSWLSVPHVTQRDEINIADLEDFRQSIKEEAAKDGIKVTPIAFIIKACAIALTHHPKLASSLSADGASIIYKDYIHIGMAVDTPAGLVVPVIRDADKKSIYELSQDIVELARKAKDRKLTPMDMQGGCFTISSLGNIGGTGFTPIVNTPEVAILGVSNVAVKPVWNGSDFVPGKMLPLSLSYDHRVINGGDGGRFMAELNALLSDVRRLAL